MTVTLDQVEGKRIDAATLATQKLLGVLCRIFLCLPYMRSVEGLERLPRRRFLLVCNHTSLLDTMLLGGVLWAARRLPVLVIGDRAVWTKSRLRRILSARVGVLIDRSRMSRDIVARLSEFGRSIEDFHLLVFPEGTRGDGRTVQTCQPGVHVVAKAAAAPIVPVFIENMQDVSTKTGPFHVLRGLRRIRVHFGEPWQPDDWAGLEAGAFCAAVRERIQALAPLAGEEPESYGPPA